MLVVSVVVISATVLCSTVVGMVVISGVAVFSEDERLHKWDLTTTLLKDLLAVLT